VDIRIKASGLVGFAGDLSRVDPKTLGDSMVEVVNEVAESAYELSRKTILSGINLTENYVERKMRLDPATKGRPRAEIVAPVGKGYFTNASHYGAMSVAQPVNWTNEQIRSMGHKFGKWPGWTRRTGTPHAGIPENQKRRKTTVEVVKGSRKSIGKKFTLPGVEDRDGNAILFKNVGPGGKEKKGLIEPVLGPSVYQLFSVAIGRIRDDVADELRDAVIRTAERELLKVIE